MMPYILTEEERQQALHRAQLVREKLEALKSTKPKKESLLPKNTGRGSRVASQAPQTFQQSKAVGGLFKSYPTKENKMLKKLLLLKSLYELFKSTRNKPRY